MGMLSAARNRIISCFARAQRLAENESTLGDSWRRLFSYPLAWWDDSFVTKNETYALSTNEKGVWWNLALLNPHWPEKERLIALQPVEVQAHPKQKTAFLHNSVVKCVGSNRYRARAGNSGSSGNIGVMRKLREEGWLEEAVEIVGKMDRAGMEITSNVILCLLQEAITRKDLSIGRELHRLTINNKLESDTFLGTFFIRLFSLFGLLGEAVEAFSKVPNPSVFTWSAMIAAHAKHGKGEDGVKLYHQMLQTTLKPEENVLVATLEACARIPSLEEGKGVHKYVMDNGLGSNIKIGTALIDMYVKCGSIQEARMVFDKAPKRDLAIWNAMIAAYAHEKCFKEALRLVQLLQVERLRPNDVTFVGILNACASVGALEEGKLIHAQISQNNYESNMLVANALIDMYIKCRSLEGARKVFDKLRNRDGITWNLIITGYTQHGHGLEALQLIPRMQQEAMQLSEAFVPLLQACSSISEANEGRLIHARVMGSSELDVSVGNALIDLYCKSANFEGARTVFDKWPKQSVVTWNAMIAGYAHHGQFQKVFSLFKQMLSQNIKPTDATFNCMLKVCSSNSHLEELGKKIHAHLREGDRESDVLVANTLVDMYASCGIVGNACEAFDKLPERTEVTFCSTG